MKETSIEKSLVKDAGRHTFSNTAASSRLREIRFIIEKVEPGGFLSCIAPAV